MLTSMTGFGRAEISLPQSGRAIVEVHSLNHKFLEVECRLPEGFQGLEEPIRAMVTQAVSRGRVRISLVLKTREQKSPVVFQTALARQYVNQLRRFQRQLGIPGGVTLEMVLNLPQVVVAPKRDLLPGQWVSLLKKGVEQALSRMKKMRRREGGHLSQVMKQLLLRLESLQGKVRKRVPVATLKMESAFASRIQSLMPTADPRRVISEAASLAQAADVSEELARIDSHLLNLRRAVQGQVESPGRTVEFLAQELQREVNTLGSKMRDANIVQWVVAMKGQIEKLREQAANVE